ncbi:MAG TPA: hypothetical protein VMZ74_16260 [Ramlibacter sp.]|nr:hypothetical protein [Ramlibacter sp.]
MRKYLLAVVAAAMPWLACAQSQIDGVWKTDPKSVTGASKPSHYIVKGNDYRCESCRPKIHVKADGQPQPLRGNPYLDSVAARIVDEHTFEVTSRKDKLVSVGTMTVAADGKSMIREITSAEANGTTSHSTEMLTRVGAPPPKGAHVVSGTWKFATLVKMSDETLTFKQAAGTLSMNASDGSGYDAQLDGTRAVMRNSPGTETVSVTTRGGTTWEEVSYSGDKPTWVNIMVVAPDGNTMKVTWEDKLRGTKGTFTMIRQYQ